MSESQRMGSVATAGMGLFRDEIFQGELGVRGIEVEGIFGCCQTPLRSSLHLHQQNPFSGQMGSLENPVSSASPLGWLGFAAA